MIIDKDNSVIHQESYTVLFKNLRSLTCVRLIATPPADDNDISYCPLSVSL